MQKPAESITPYLGLGFWESPTLKTPRRRYMLPGFKNIFTMQLGRNSIVCSILRFEIIRGWNHSMTRPDEVEPYSSERHQ